MLITNCNCYQLLTNLQCKCLCYLLSTYPSISKWELQKQTTFQRTNCNYVVLVVKDTHLFTFNLGVNPVISVYNILYNLLIKMIYYDCWNAQQNTLSKHVFTTVNLFNWIEPKTTIVISIKTPTKMECVLGTIIFVAVNS